MNSNGSGEFLMDRLLSFIVHVSSPDGGRPVLFAQRVLAVNTLRLFSTIISFKIKYGTLAANYMRNDIVGPLEVDRADASVELRNKAFERCAEIRVIFLKSAMILMLRLSLMMGDRSRLEE